MLAMPRQHRLNRPAGFAHPERPGDHVANPPSTPRTQALRGHNTDGRHPDCIGTDFRPALLIAITIDNNTGLLNTKHSSTPRAGQKQPRQHEIER